MNWTLLGIVPTQDKQAITAAYRAQLAHTNPEDKPEEFKALRAAYEEALRLADRPSAAPTRDTSPVGLWMEQVHALYHDFAARIRPENWEELLQADVCMALDSRPLAEEALLRFLMQDFYIPQSVWQVLDRTFAWTERREELYETYPRDFTAHDNQTRVNVKVLQGESRMAYHNLQLGEISVPVPAGPKGNEAVDITYTYDVNALLEVEVFVHSTGVRRRIIIQNEQNRLSEEEAARRLAELQYLKQNPREEETNRLQLLRGERLYEEMPGRRQAIDRALMAFEQVLSRQDRTEIEQARKQLTRLLDEIEFDLH